MIKIPSIQQIRDVDAYTVANEPILSTQLIWRAANAFVDRLFNAIPLPKIPQFMIFCGPGNNGADGLGVAILLTQMGIPVTVFVDGKTPGSDEYGYFLKLFNRLKGVNCLEEMDWVSLLNSSKTEMVIVDSIYGNGINRPVDGIFKKVIEALNKTDCLRIALDIPSGLLPDISVHKNSVVFKAHFTLAFQFPRLAFFFAENYQYVGDWFVIDIELHPDAIANIATPYNMVEIEDVVSKIPKRSKFAHKGNFGKVMMVGGSYGMVGSIMLASRACLKAGAGLVTCHIPKCGYTAMQAFIPEVMVNSDFNELLITEIAKPDNVTCVGIGPGLGKASQTAIAFVNFLKCCNFPIVIDADALNFLSSLPDLFKFVPCNSILTPHLVEFKRLVGNWESDFQLLNILKDFAFKHQVVVVLKGAYTCIASPDAKCYFNSTGNSGMATAGSGDVLTGIITGLLAQGLNSVDAAILGVYLHGYAGDLAARKMGIHSIIASDIIDNLGNAFLEISRHPI